MSERTQNRSAGQGPETKAQRRLAAQLAAQKAAEAKKRRQAWLGALAGLAVIAVIVGVFVVTRGGDDDAAKPAASPAGCPGGFPTLPDGADRALCTKPPAGKGEGELSGLKATPLIRGTGAAAQSGQQITVNYVGVSYRTGEEFDASWKRSEPFSFMLGQGNVIPGWDQGLQGQTVGSRVQLDIPADLAYGDKPQRPGAPSGPLRFIVDVLAVQ
ncbi:peptidylprolyl isomerase [Micromonospora purpureochromogenes]|uniref:Peptidyl-prolyl cis-trans isomerase n=1 Tax=Micromonospora purpureochromogenes TaxID=47872 RepID=A0A1C5AJG7_9ACTN|nr:FKBP-type peptidyl-prolyl cis-trans isomerase [Micromonospora purpureochromogenes]SCE65205.1 peptidylprolyl isomerase [Micromonospora purpureochromogenes]SCF45375.1 peptidylprolyl isomerase [Micromonospora purpureochromogenes]